MAAYRDFEPGNFSSQSLLSAKGLQKNSRIIEIGPRLNFETAFSTNAVAICHACGIDKYNSAGTFQKVSAL